MRCFFVRAGRIVGADADRPFGRRRDCEGSLAVFRAQAHFDGFELWDGIRLIFISSSTRNSSARCEGRFLGQTVSPLAAR